jgi:hypothetical protein
MIIPLIQNSLIVQSKVRDELSKRKGVPQPRTFSGVDELKSHVGKELGTSGWLEITQERVNAFADATADWQWIHVEPERARRESPFGGPVAHGFLTLSLLPFLNGEASPHIKGMLFWTKYNSHLAKLRCICDLKNSCCGCYLLQRTGPLSYP